MPQIALPAVCYAEGSESWAANRPLRGQSHGCFRKTCRQTALLRSITRKVPKDTPQIDSPHGLAYGSIRKTDRQSANLRSVIRKHPKNEPRNATPAYRYTEASERTTKKLTHRGTAYGKLRKTDRRGTSLRHNARMLPKNGLRGRAQHLPISVMPPPSTTCECSRPCSISLSQKPCSSPAIGEVVPQICST